MIPTRQSQWEGFTLEQIRYERELNNAHIDLITHKLHKLAEAYSTPREPPLRSLAAWSMP